MEERHKLLYEQLGYVGPMGKSTPAPLLFLETNPRYLKWTNLRQDGGNNGYCIMSLTSDGSVGLQYEDWMTQRRCEASLTRTATGRLHVSSVVPVFLITGASQHAN